MDRVPRVLVTDPEQRAALAAVRALGRAGYHPITIGASRGLAGVSRYVAHHVDVDPASARDAESYAAAVGATIGRLGVDVVVPVTDAASRVLLPLADRLGARLAGPSAQAYERASDKEGLTRVASSLGIRVPQQVVLSYEERRDTAGLPWTGGAVVKPSRSVVMIAGGTSRFGVQYVDSVEQLPRALSSYPEEAFPLLVQERCAGEGLGVFLLRDRGETLMVAGHRRLREKPPSGGVSTYRESIVPEQSLVTRCEALLDQLEYSGPAMIEFKAGPGDALPALMEINARLWGSVQLAIDAGANFPVALVQWAMGRPVDRARAIAGVRSFWEIGEIDHCLTVWRRSAKELNLPVGTPVGLRGAWRAAFNRRITDRAEVFRWNDPRPFFAEASGWLTALRPRTSADS